MQRLILPIGDSTYIAMDVSQMNDGGEKEMTKLEKIGADLEKARQRRDQWEQRVKHLEERYREEENTVIYNMVQAANLTPEMLAQIIAMADQGKVGVYTEMREAGAESSQGNVGVYLNENTEDYEEGYDNGTY